MPWDFRRPKRDEAIMRPPFYEHNDRQFDGKREIPVEKKQTMI